MVYARVKEEEPVLQCSSEDAEMEELCNYSSSSVRRNGEKIASFWEKELRVDCRWGSVSQRRLSWLRLSFL